MRLTPNNNYVAGTQFSGITFTPTVAGPFTLNGNLISLTGNITDSTQAFTNTINFPLALQTTPTVNITQFGSLTINGIISGGFGLNETGSGLLTLSGGNTFTGPVTVGNGATLSIAGDANLGAPPRRDTRQYCAGRRCNAAYDRVRISRSTPIAGIRIVNAGGTTPANATLTVSTGQTLTYNGVIRDNGTAGGLTKLSFGNLNLGGANTYTGPTRVGNGVLTLDFTQPTAPTTNIISSSSSLIMGGSTAGLGNTSFSRLTLNGTAAATNSQTFNGTLIDIGPAVLTASGANTTLNLGALTHNAGGALDIAPATTNGIITTTATNTNGILGAWATVGNTTQNNVIQGSDWATVNASGQIVPYTGYTAYTSGNLNGVVNASHEFADHPGATAAVVPADADAANRITDINTIAFKNTAAWSEPIYLLAMGNTLRLGKFGGIMRQDVSTNGADDYDRRGHACCSGRQWHDWQREYRHADRRRCRQHARRARLQYRCQQSDRRFGDRRGQDYRQRDGSGHVCEDRRRFDEIRRQQHLHAVAVTFCRGAFSWPAAKSAMQTRVDLARGPVFVFPGAYVFPAEHRRRLPITNDFFLAGVGTNAEPIGAIRLGNGVTMSGTIHLIGDARIGNGNATSTISGRITGGFNMDFGAASSVASIMTISNPLNDWTGNTTIVGRTGGTAGNCLVHLGADEVIPNGVGKGNLLMGLSGDTVSTETVDLNGHNETVNGVVSPAGVTASLTFIENDVATPATLTLGDNNQTANFGGTIRDGTGMVTVTKIGTGVQTLSGANSYSGVTNVNNGAISVTGSLNASGTVNLNTSATTSGTLYGTGQHGNCYDGGGDGSAKGGHQSRCNGSRFVRHVDDGRRHDRRGHRLAIRFATPGTSDQIVVGSLNFSGGATVSPSGTPVAGDYIVVQSSGTITGSALTLNTANDTRLTFGFAPTSWNPGTNANSQQVSDPRHRPVGPFGMVRSGRWQRPGI